MQSHFSSCMRHSQRTTAHCQVFCFYFHQSFRSQQFKGVSLYSLPLIIVIILIPCAGRELKGGFFLKGLRVITILIKGRFLFRQVYSVTQGHRSQVLAFFSVWSLQSQLSMAEWMSSLVVQISTSLSLKKVVWGLMDDGSCLH